MGPQGLGVPPDARLSAGEADEDHDDHAGGAQPEGRSSRLEREPACQGRAGEQGCQRVTGPCRLAQGFCGCGGVLSRAAQQVQGQGCREALLTVAGTVPEHLDQVTTTVRQKTAASGAVGLLTAIAVPIILMLVVLDVVQWSFVIGPS